jgi:hypothetical protein
MIISGIAFKLAELLFDPNAPYTCCRICGSVFQSTLDRHGSAPVEALLKRRAWSFYHASTHSEHEHRMLKLSGNWCTPEAAKKLTPFGIIDLVGLVMDDEIESAYKEADKEVDVALLRSDL